MKKQAAIDQHIIGQNKAIQKQWVFLIAFCLLIIILALLFFNDVEEQIPEGEWECVENISAGFNCPCNTWSTESRSINTTFGCLADSYCTCLEEIFKCRYEFVKYGDEE